MAFAHAVWAGPADDIKALLDRGDARGAYALGNDTPVNWATRPSIPNNLQARLELARVYFVLGEDTRAREEFEDVRSANPGPACSFRPP